MKQNDIHIIFQQNKHEVDVNTLISCLLRTSSLIQTVNQSLNTNRKIDIKIKALEKGSFEIHLELVENIIRNIFTMEGLSFYADIIGVTSGLYALCKFLRGKRPKEVKKGTNTTTIINNYDERIIINNNVFNIFNENKIVREELYTQFSDLQKNEDINGFSVITKDNQVDIDREQFAELSTPIEAVEEEKEPKVECKLNQHLHIIRASFDRKLKWDFVYDGHKISALLKDENLIKSIEQGEDFAKGDTLIADLEVTRFYDKDYKAYIIDSNSYKILSFKTHDKVARQRGLFDKLED